MRRSTFLVLVFVAALVAAFVPAAARADGLPVLGVDVGSSGVSSSSDGARYVTIPAGSRTIVERVAQHGGQVLAWRSLRGTFTIPAVAYDASAGGLSADGMTLVLIQPRASFPRATTRLLVLEAGSLKPQRLVQLKGDFSFDALSPNGSWLYLIHYVAPTDPTRYLVRAYDLTRGRLLAKPIIDPHEPGEKMRGTPLSRTMSTNGRWAYTLYDGAGATPFVHALDTVARSARCIDLAGIPSRTDLWQLRLGIDGPGRRLVVRDRATPLLLINLRTLRVARAADAVPPPNETRQFTPVLIGASSGGLVLLIACAFWLRRKQRPNVPLASQS
jgi:hypothetical protein